MFDPITENVKALGTIDETISVARRREKESVKGTICARRAAWWEGRAILKQSLTLVGPWCDGLTKCMRHGERQVKQGLGCYGECVRWWNGGQQMDTYGVGA